MFVPHVDTQWKFGDLLVPARHADRDGVINFFYVVFLELNIQRAVGFRGFGEDHNAARKFIQAVDNENFAEFFFEQFDKIRRVFVPAIGQHGQACGFVEEDDVVVGVENIHKPIVLYMSL